jgi:RND family efflux transporter MFP subunit
MRIAKHLCPGAAAAALGLLAAACRPAGPAVPPGTPPPPAVTVRPPAQREVTDWDEYPGRMEAAEMVDVQARVSGYLQSILFKDGAEVRKGDLLFVIDPRPYQAELDRAAADLQQAQTHEALMSNDVARADRMLASKAISEEEADTRRTSGRMAGSEVAMAQAAVETAKLNLEYTRITAPISGRIGRRLRTEGNLVNGNMGQSTLLATIVSLDPIYCYFEADERSFLKYQTLAREGKGGDIRDGKVACEAELANETGFPHRGALDFVDNQTDPATGTMRMRGIFPNPDRVLQPGLFARVRVPGSARYTALLIPDEAVGTDQSQKFVSIVNATNTVESRRVTLGPMVDGLRVVREGLGSNDLVIVNGLMSARPGMVVQPMKPGAAAAPAPPPAAAKTDSP